MVSQETPAAPHQSVGNESKNGAASRSESQELTSPVGGDGSEAVTSLESADDTIATDGTPSNATIPVQKRRRVTRACDECRRKKIKCDGKQPCTHCTVYSYVCTYDQPSNRRRNPAPQYIEALETRLQRAEALFRVILPDVDLDDPRFDTDGVEEILSSLGKKQSPDASSESEAKQRQCPDKCEESLLESMVDNTGSLDLDDQGHWDYHGHSSGLIFVRRLRKQFGNLVPDRPPSKFQHITQIIEGVKSASESPIDSHLSPVHDLPPRDVARKLCDNALEESCIILRFTHKPTFYAMFDRIYDTPVEQFSNKENSFIPLLYSALAVGCVFRGAGDCTLEKSGYEPAVDQGLQYFKACRQLIDITECRDLTSLQTVLFMILFLQASANLSTCYSYVGIALRAALRLGLHRWISTNFNPIELETRRRVFWVARTMDVHVSTILGLPWMLTNDDIDQLLPLEIEDEYITAERIIPMPPGQIALMAGPIANVRLIHILLKVTKYIYPINAANPGSNHTYMVSHSKIREIEQDLQAWKEELPDIFKPGGDAPPKIERLRQLLRISYAHVQMVMYRPFLHYVSGGSRGSRGVDKRSYACAAACVSVARNVVHITAELKKKQLLNGSYWFTMYTTYFAILSLLFFILENPESAASKDGILKDALEGKNTLAGLAKRSMAADRCTQSLVAIFKHLPERLRNRHGNAPPPVSRKRTQPTPPSPTSILKTKGTRTPPAPPKDGEEMIPTPVRRSNTFPIHVPSDSLNIAPQNNSTQSPSSGAGGSNTPPTSHKEWPSLTTSRPISTAPDGDSPQIPSPLSAHQHHHPNPTPLNQELSFSPQFDNPSRLPDLMPMMFPSDDPFAYPNQPMSILEDGHFKHDSRDIHGKFAYRHGAAMTPADSTPCRTSASSPSLKNNPGFGAFPNQDPGTMPSLPSRPKGRNRFSTHERTPSEPVHDSARSGYMENPDLVTLSGQSFLWQSLANDGSQADLFQQPAAGQMFVAGAEDLGMQMDIGMSGLGDLGMGMGVDMGMNMDFDSSLASMGMCDGRDINTDWTQWPSWDNGNGSGNGTDRQQ